MHFQTILYGKQITYLPMCADTHTVYVHIKTHILPARLNYKRSVVPERLCFTGAGEVRYEGMGRGHS